LPTAPLGLYEASVFRLTTGDRAGDSLSASAKFLFRSEVIAVPVEGPFANFALATDPFADLRTWVASPGELTRPSLVWIAATQRETGVRVAADGQSIGIGDARRALELVPKIALNRSWTNTATFAWLSRRSVTLRGESKPSGAFVARTIWPEDWRLDDHAPAVSLPAAESPQFAIRGLLRSAPRGGAESPFETHVIWERNPGIRDWTGRAAIGLMVNGAQGDDDEAWGGHFALMTGRCPADGRLSDFLVANFYSLDVESEKGILAAPAPLDNYLGDLNSGQAWYRPSYILFVLLADERAATLVQGALNRIYPQFWRRQLTYRHATMNCASISVDTLRALGWQVPVRSPSHCALAWLSIPATIFRVGTISAARTTYEYLTEDVTRLMPAAALEEAAVDLLRLAQVGARASDGTLAKWLGADVVALVGMRVPQLPSSRRLGTWPVASSREYLAAMPDDPADAEIVPVPPRPFPDELRDADLLPPAPRRSTLPLLAWTATGILPVAWIAGVAWRLLRSLKR
jgi:hypothetical protein